MKNIEPYNNTNLYAEIKHLIEEARKQVVRSVNSAMVFTYWEIGKRIVEEEQKGEDRAEYGTYLLRNLSEELTREFGKGFNERCLRRMRQFYLLFPIRSALRTELSWTHYRLLFNIEKEEVRNYYLTESIVIEQITRFFIGVGQGIFIRSTAATNNYRSRQTILH
jgi:hypothetical protein